mmetsp:Transcript_11333/g.16645  ORF Transcript_11333/g.16645 Transcript_11333/m.16645 type:complete len:138 (-) Transcript_11333:227-640(-)
MTIHITAPKENHIICGRGPRNYKHQGNVRFRQLVEKSMLLYIISSKKMKSGVVEKIVAELKNENMVFVEYNTKEACWKELVKEESKKKFAHRFRDSVRQEEQCNLFDSSDPLFPQILQKVKQNATESRFLNNCDYST